MSSAWAFTVLIGLFGLERLAELVVSQRNVARTLARGGREYGRGHYPWMVLLHTGFLAGALVEVWVAGRPFVAALGWPMLGLALAAQGLRWWCVTMLGEAWNTRVVVLPGRPLIHSGPYRWLRHPNYVAVVVEGVALPLVHTAWLTALAFTVLNAVLLRVRIRVEDSALGRIPAAP